MFLQGCVDRVTADFLFQLSLVMRIAVTAQLISAFVFAIRIVQSLYYLNPKFQASCRLLWLNSLVCDRPGRKPRRPVFSQRGSINREGKPLYPNSITSFCRELRLDHHGQFITPRTHTLRKHAHAIYSNTSRL